MWNRIQIGAIFLLSGLWAAAYPLDGYEWTQIRRLHAFDLIQQGKLAGHFKLPAGALLATDQIELGLEGINESYDLLPTTAPDSQLQTGIERILKGRDTSYRIAVLDITDPSRPRFAALRPDQGYIPGSVGKLLVMTGIFDQLKKRFPRDVEARAQFLRQTRIVADNFVIPNSHQVPVVADGFKSVAFRSIHVGDEFTLWEWIDHMISPSSNAAASMVWKTALLMDLLPKDAFPLTPDREQEIFRQTPKTELTERAIRVLEAPLEKAGIDVENLRIRTFFTSGAGRVIPGKSSHSTPRELVRWLLRLEQGKLVDSWSSREMKKLLYFTRRRYRFASSPALIPSAVYFKSGSLYRCKPEPEYQCAKYKGNVENLMHSVAIVETPESENQPRLHYLISMMSNVLRVNSAWEHSVIAGELHNLIRSQNKKVQTPLSEPKPADQKGVQSR